MRLRTFAAAAGFAALAALPALAQDKPVELKFAHWLPPAHPLHKTSFAEWTKSISDASGGSIKVTIYPAQQLGKAPDHYDMARDGIADLAWINPGYQAGRFPVFAAVELPFTAANAAAGSRAIDAWYRKYAAAEMADVRYCLAHAHDPGVLHSKKEIKSPDQIKGMKIRPANGTIAQFVTLMGGSNVQTSAPEAREALEKGVADALTFPWDSIFIFGIDKVTTFHLDVPMYVTGFVIPMNKDSYAKLSPAQKKVMDDHCTSQWAEKIATHWAAAEAAGKAKMAAAPGHTIVKIGDAEVNAWRKAAEPLVGRWAEAVKKKNLDADKVIGELKGELKKADAAY
jgi:TRAP-type C4-dicarboxylate transport system substrate-binding protein